MGNLTIRDREILIATYAMRVFMTAIELVREDWRPEDILIATELLAKLETAHAEATARRKRENAANNH